MSPRLHASSDSIVVATKVALVTKCLLVCIKCACNICVNCQCTSELLVECVSRAKNPASKITSVSAEIVWLILVLAVSSCSVTLLVILMVCTANCSLFRCG